MKIFFNSNDEKITEKAFSSGLIISVISILLCIVMLCSMTYAWFSTETTSSSNTVVAGSFDVDVSVSVSTENGDTESEEILLTKVEYKNNTYSCVLPEANTCYTVTFDLKDDASIKGYCIVEINGVRRTTEVIVGEDTVNKGEYQDNSPLTFDIKTVEADTVVEFTAMWGVSADPYIYGGQTYTVGAWSNISFEGSDQ